LEQQLFEVQADNKELRAKLAEAKAGQLKSNGLSAQAEESTAANTVEEGPTKASNPETEIYQTAKGDECIWTSPQADSRPVVMVDAAGGSAAQSALTTDLHGGGRGEHDIPPSDLLHKMGGEQEADISDKMEGERKELFRSFLAFDTDKVDWRFFVHQIHCAMVEATRNNCDSDTAIDSAILGQAIGRISKDVVLDLIDALDCPTSTLLKGILFPPEESNRLTSGSKVTPKEHMEMQLQVLFSAYLGAVVPSLCQGSKASERLKQSDKNVLMQFWHCILDAKVKLENRLRTSKYGEVVEFDKDEDTEKVTKTLHDTRFILHINRLCEILAKDGRDQEMDIKQMLDCLDQLVCFKIIQAEHLEAGTTDHEDHEQPSIALPPLVALDVQEHLADEDEGHSNSSRSSNSSSMTPVVEDLVLTTTNPVKVWIEADDDEAEPCEKTGDSEAEPSETTADDESGPCDVNDDEAELGGKTGDDEAEPSETTAVKGNLSSPAVSLSQARDRSDSPAGPLSATRGKPPLPAKKDKPAPVTKLTELFDCKGRTKDKYTVLMRTRRNWGLADVFDERGLNKRFDHHNVHLHRLDECIKDLKEKVSNGTEVDSPNPNHVPNAVRLKDSLWVLRLYEEHLPARLLAFPDNGGMEVSDWCKQIHGAAEKTESPPIGTSTSLSTPAAVGGKAHTQNLRTSKRFHSAQKKVNVMFPLPVGMLPDSFLTLDVLPGQTPPRADPGDEFDFQESERNESGAGGPSGKKTRTSNQSAAVSSLLLFLTVALHIINFAPWLG